MGRVMLRKRHASRNHYWRASNLLRAAVMPRKRHVSRNAGNGYSDADIACHAS